MWNNKVNGKLNNPEEPLMKAINYYKDMKDLFIQVDSSSKMVEESKKYSKKNVFKQFRKMPIKLKIFI